MTFPYSWDVHFDLFCCVWRKNFTLAQNGILDSRAPPTSASQVAETVWVCAVAWLYVQSSPVVTYVYSYRHLIIENFIPLEEKNKIMNRSFFDDEEDHWKLHPITRLE